jgi:hypothetical protein
MPSDTPSSGFPSANADIPPSSGARKKAVFFKEGDYWTVGLGGDVVRLKDLRGLAYIAYLLRHPGAEFHVLDLAGGIAGGREERETDRLEPGQENLQRAGIHIGNLGDAGELLDDQAKRAYRRRLSELREELEEAKALGKAETADQLEKEIDALTGELSRAVGLGGRSRRAASASERARQTITKAIRAATERIAQGEASLGDVLSRCLKTGTFCSYQPESGTPISWEFAPARAEPPQPSPAPGVEAAADSGPPSGTLDIVAFSTPKRTRFIGREHECGTIRAAIDRAHSGNGSLVMLAGGPGVGKTRLAIELAEFAAGYGAAFFLGRCYERDEPFPYLPFVQIIEAMLSQAPSREDFRRQIGDNAAELAQLLPRLRRILPDIPETTELPDPLKRRYLFQSVTEVLERAARTRPLLLILDDLQWADESTLALLTHLANRIAQLPMVIIATYRDENSEDNPALTRTLEELIRRGIRPLKLIGLSRNCVAQMLDELSQRHIPEGVVNALLVESNGIPLFVEEG